MAELADALVLGTSGLPVQVQVLLSAFRREVPVKTVLFLFYRENILLYSYLQVRDVCFCFEECRMWRDYSANSAEK